MTISISGIRQDLDPSKQYQHCEIGHVIIAMGRLPKCIDLNRPDSLISQVMTACSINSFDLIKHVFHPEIDKDGAYEHVHRLAAMMQGKKVATPIHAIGVMSRLVGGDYQAIYFYADGTIIVIDKWHNYKFHMEG